MPAALPILPPVQLPGQLINLAPSRFNRPYLLGNPFADASAPALKILVNTGYSDVVARPN